MPIDIGDDEVERKEVDFIGVESGRVTGFADEVLMCREAGLVGITDDFEGISAVVGLGRIGSVTDRVMEICTPTLAICTPLMLCFSLDQFRAGQSAYQFCSMQFYMLKVKRYLYRNSNIAFPALNAEKR